MNTIHTCSKQNRGRTNIIGGILLLAIGGILLARQFGYLFPSWLFTWPMILIVVGLFVALKTGFRDLTWLGLLPVGLIFLLDDIYPEIGIQRYAWPMFIILAGILLIFIPRRKRDLPVVDEALDSPSPVASERYTASSPEIATTAVQSEPEVLEIVSIFGGIKKKVLSKNLRGGEIVSVFGGSEVNLSQADFKHLIEIEVVQVFGGTKLIVPANWEVRSECFVMLGGIDDKRRMQEHTVSDKILVLKGVTILGGIEISSY